MNKKLNDPNRPRRCIFCGHGEFTLLEDGARRCASCGDVQQENPFSDCPVRGCSGTLYQTATYKQGGVSVTERQCGKPGCHGKAIVVSAVTQVFTESDPRKSGARASINKVMDLPDDVFCGLGLRAPRKGLP